MAPIRSSYYARTGLLLSLVTLSQTCIAQDFYGEASGYGRQPTIQEPPQEMPPYKIKVGEQVNLSSLKFSTRLGEERNLSEVVLPNKPILLIPVYFRCGSRCSLVLNALISSLRGIDQHVGKDFTILSASISFLEQPALAQAKAESYFSVLPETEREGAMKRGGWEFLTGTEEMIASMCAQTGYNFWRSSDHFTHPQIVMVLDAKGKITASLDGTKVDAKMLSEALKDAQLTESRS